MAGDRGPQLLRRIEASVARSVGTTAAPALAFSGGLGSVLTAAVARKRGDLTCLVAGVYASPDLEASLLAEAYLDYRVEPVVLSKTACVRLARRIAAEAPGLPLAEITDLVPLVAVRERAGSGHLLSGCRPGLLSNESRAYLRALRVRAPLDAALGGRVRTDRGLLSEAADLLGLPRTFGHARPRRPGCGSGVEGALRAAARENGAPLARLVRPIDSR